MGLRSKYLRSREKAHWHISTLANWHIFLFAHYHISKISNYQINPMQTASDYIEFYQLQPHPEGGWYQETYKSEHVLPVASLPGGVSGDRSLSTAIYFLLEAGNFSAFHRIQSDECWHFYAGDALEILVLDPSGELRLIRLGSDVQKGERFQYIVPAGYWFASRPAAGSRYCFVGCTVAPGFDFADFELASAAVLTAAFPQHSKLIHEMCRE